MFLSISDFTGKYQLHTGMYDQAKLLDYIQIYESKYLVRLFGVDLYNEFMSDLDANNMPKSPNFLSVYNPFFYQIDMLRLIESDGLITMLKGFVYFEYLKDLTNQMTPFGNVVPVSENSKVVTPLYSMMYNRYNQSVRTHNAIIAYMMHNYNIEIGQCVEFSILNSGTGYVSDSDVQLTTLSESPSSISIGAVGSGYTTGFNIPTIGGSGTGLTLDITAIAGSLSFVSINQYGSGYTANDIVLVDDGLGIGGLVNILSVYPQSVGDNAEVNTLAHNIDGVHDTLINAVGTGYIDTPNCTTSGGLGSGCIVNVIEDGSGGVGLITIVNEGQGYLVGDTLTINAGNNDATFDILTTWNGEIYDLTISKGGSNYKVGDTLLVTGGDSNALLQCFYVGKGQYNTMRGLTRQTAYWI